ncbi:hypothetical protein I1A62_04410 (plasmid) [Rhodococcus sp. USK10]|nr:hypothetical protein I1A62_04410 [Rhodococcus sp. USK10]
MLTVAQFQAQQARATLEAVTAAGVAYDDVTNALEREGVAKFIASWNELLNAVGAALDAAR